MYVSPNYVYYDGTSIPSYYAYWASGYPTGKTLVAMNNNLRKFENPTQFDSSLNFRTIWHYTKFNGQANVP